MNAYKIIFSFFILMGTSFAADQIDSKGRVCPEPLEEAMDEAVRLSMSGFQSDPRPSCLKQDDFKYFDLRIGDVIEGPKPKKIALQNDATYKVIKTRLSDTGNLYIDVKITSGKNTYTDTFSIYYDKTPTRCVGFFSLPKNNFVKESCKK